MKSILIPIDYSAYAKTAINLGITLAKKTGAELYLLNVFKGPDDWNRISVDQQQMHPEIEGNMVEAEINMERITKDKIFKGVKVTGIVRPGVIQEQIQHFANLYKCELVIMGAHGKGESHRYFIGSHAQKVLRTMACPVLSVKKDFKAGSIKRILFAADFEDNLVKAFGQMTGFIKAAGASVDLVFINTPGHFKESLPMQNGMDKLMKAYPDIKMRSLIYNATEVERGIIEVADILKAQVIAKITHDRRHKPGYYFGVTESLLYKSNLPVLSLVV